MIPQTYGVVSDPAIASYSYSDIAGGTGYVTYYGGKVGISGSTSYIASPKKFYSDIIITTAATSASWTKMHDIDFDYIFALPQTIKGELLATIPVGRYAAVSVATAMYPIVKVRKYNGSIETEIAQGTTTVWTSTNTTGVKTDNFNVKVTVPRTSYKAGETLRITLEIWGFSSTAANIYIGADPYGRVTQERNPNSTDNFAATDNTILFFEVPFQIDL